MNIDQVRENLQKISFDYAILSLDKENLKKISLDYAKFSLDKDNLKKAMVELLPALMLSSGLTCKVEDLVQQVCGFYISAILEVFGAELQITYDGKTCQETRDGWLMVFSTPNKKGQFKNFFTILLR